MEDDSTTEYDVRPFEDGDREGFLSLYETVWDERRSPEWFEWRYGEGTSLDHVPVFVAETTDGEIVGARPLAPFRMRTPARDVVGLHPSNTMVHPDHRGQGLFGRMSAACTEFYVDSDPAFYFNFPNEAALQGNLKFGYREVGSVPVHYRVHNPNAFIDEGVDGWRGRLLDVAAEPLARGYLRLRHRTAGVDSGVDVERYRGVPAELLASLYEERIPDRIHAVRDADFYGWRFADPEHPATTYVAFDGDEPIAGVVTYRDEVDGARRVKLADLVPLVPSERRDAGVAAILSTVTYEHRDADVMVAVGRTFPDAELRSFGFHRDDRLPLSKFVERTTLVAYPLVPEDEDGWRLGGCRLDAIDDWRVTFAERDTT